MSICRNCFEEADHTGHDFSRFISNSGGKCDCGDGEVIDIAGFCKHHGQNRDSIPQPPEELTVMVEFVAVKLMLGLLVKFRGYVGFLLEILFS